MNIVDAVPLLNKHPIYTVQDEEHPVPIYLNEYNDSKFVIITGDNATGKSYFTKMLVSWMAKYENTYPIFLSMIGRTGSGVNDSGIKKALTYGDQSEQSTGETSVNVVKKSFLGIKTWMENDSSKNYIIVLDEPDVGLSEGYQYALGEYIGQKYKEIKKESPFAGIMLVTHSKSLIKGILKNEIHPSYINSGNKDISLNDWLNTVEKRSVEDLLNLKDKALDIRKKIYGIEEKAKKLKNKKTS